MSDIFARLPALMLCGVAACAEIAGCFSYWAWLRLGKTSFWLIPGNICLVLFAFLLTLSPSDHAGRAYAFYGGIYIIISLIWSWLVEEIRPDRWDLVGAAFCLCGALIILYAPHTHAP